MDEPHLDPVALRCALRELVSINRSLGGHRTSKLALAEILSTAPGGELTLLDVGSGSGDTGIKLVNAKHGRLKKVVAIDLNRLACQACAHRASRESPGRMATVAADVFHLPFPAKCFDLVHCSLFLHHFTDDDSTKILRSLASLARIGLIVNDLHRHPLAYWSVRIGSLLMSSSEYVRHDGPVSVLRGYKRQDLLTLLRSIGAMRRFPPLGRWVVAHTRGGAS